MAEQPTGRAAWDKRDDESDAAYARFLVYRNLGPARSLDAAYALAKPKATKGNKRQRYGGTSISGQWTRDSVQFEWKTRADVWDVEMLTEVGKHAVVNFIHTLEAVSVKTLQELANAKRRPANWHEIMEAVNLLGSFIPAETVAALQSDAAEHRTPAIGGSGQATERNAV